MNFTYDDYKKIKVGSKEYNDICYQLFINYGKNLEALTLKDDPTFISRVEKLTNIINEKNLMKTRDMEEVIAAVRTNKCNNTFINTYYKDNKEVKYYYIAQQIARAADNKDMLDFFTNKLESIYKLINKEFKND